jgi:uncharacterized membrane protein YfcA
MMAASMSTGVYIILIISAWITATISGFLGMAGGISLLAIMTIFMPATLVVPIHGVVQLCSNLTRTIVFIKHVRWPIFFTYSPPLVVGVYAATLVWSGDKLDWFKPVIGTFVLCFLMWRRFKPTLRNLPLWTYAPLGLVTGFLAIFVGATGPFIAPFFLRDDLTKEEVVANKAIVQTWLHLFKIPAFLSLGFNYTPHWQLLSWLVVAVVIGNLLGKWLLTRISHDMFILLFEVLLAVVGVYLLLSNLF